MIAHESQRFHSPKRNLTPGTPEFNHFWQNDIGFDVDTVNSVGEDTSLTPWISKRSKVEILTLLHLLNQTTSGTLNKQRNRLRQCGDELWPYRLVDRFAVRRSKRIVEDVVTEFLDESMIQYCQDKKGVVCVRAALYLLYSQSAGHLLTVQHLQSMEKRGFGHLHLSNPPRRPEQEFHDFVTQSDLDTILITADASLRDGRHSELREVLRWKDRSIIFIRRPAHHRVILAEGHLVHGFDPDLLMMEFADNGKLLRIAGHNTRPARVIADRLASAYRQSPCQYDETMDQAYSAQVKRLVDALVKCVEVELALIEISTKQSPLDGASGITIRNDDASCLSFSLSNLNRLGVPLHDSLDRIESLTVEFQGKRVKLTLEQGGEDCLTIRYSDHRLGLLQRGAFEDYFRSQYGISILPTERPVAVEKKRRCATAS